MKVSPRPSVHARRRATWWWAAAPLLVVVLGACGDRSGGELSAGSTPPEPSAAATPSTSSASSVATLTVPVTAPPTAPDASEFVVPVTTNAEPSGGLELCADVPAMATEVVGDDPSGMGPDFVFLGVLLTYAQEHPDTFGGLWIDREANGTVVLAFTDDPAAHREALALRRPSPDDAQPIEPPLPITDDRPIGEWDIAFDVVQVTYTEAELKAGTDSVMGVLAEAGDPNFGAGSDLMRNRVSLFPSDPLTAEGADAIAAGVVAVVPLEMVCLMGEIVDAAPASIAPGIPLDVIVLPAADGTYPPDTAVECGGVTFTLGDLQTLTPIEEADAGLQAVVAGWIDGTEGDGWPDDGWVVLTETEELATLVSIVDGAMSVIGAEMGRNGWIWSGASGGGPCVVHRVLPAGTGSVEWAVDPAFAAPDAAATEVHVLATETACTGGSELGERLLGPHVVETDDAVRIAFASIALTGAQRCPGNPSTPVTITLARPLGARVLLDGLAIAPLADLVAAG